MFWTRNYVWPQNDHFKTVLAFSDIYSPSFLSVFVWLLLQTFFLSAWHVNASFLKISAACILMSLKFWQNVQNNFCCCIFTTCSLQILVLKFTNSHFFTLCLLCPESEPSLCVPALHQLSVSTFSLEIFQTLMNRFYHKTYGPNDIPIAIFQYITVQMNSSLIYSSQFCK